MSSYDSIIKWAKEAKILLKKKDEASLAGVKTNLSMIISQAAEEALKNKDKKNENTNYN